MFLLFKDSVLDSSKAIANCGTVDIAMHTIERYFCPGTDTQLTDSIAEAVIKTINRAGVECIKNPENYEARANMMWASSLAHNGLTQCGRFLQINRNACKP